MAAHGDLRSRRRRARGRRAHELHARPDADGVSDSDEIALGWDPTNPDEDGDGILDGLQDTDGDGVTDWLELSVGTDPRSAPGSLDSDADGLDDEHEAIMGTDPHDRDTDDDRLADTEFLLHQTDPADADTDHDGIGDQTEIEVLRSDALHADQGRSVVADGDTVSVTDELRSIDPMFWNQCSDHDRLAFDELSVVDSWVTVSDPDDGPIDSPVHGAAHGCAVHEFGPWAADDVEVEWTWSAQRPLEATPLLHVDLDTDEGGIGMWPGNDLFAGVPGSQSVWALGYIGRDNSHFEMVSVQALSPAELATWSDPANPAPPARMKIRSSGGTITVFLERPPAAGLHAGARLAAWLLDARLRHRQQPGRPRRRSPDPGPPGRQGPVDDRRREPVESSVSRADPLTPPWWAASSTGAG